MFGDGFIQSIQEGIDLIQKADGTRGFQSAISQMCDYLQKRNYDSKCIQEIDRRSIFIANEYSEKDTKDKIEEAKKRVLNYIDNLMSGHEDDGILLKVLNNFHLYLEGIFERELHKDMSFQEEDIQKVRIKKECDLQFFLYAYLRPLFPMIRAEVPEDMGYGGPTRPDFVISSDCAIEVKYTRKSMSIGKLKEEITADITHYSEKELYFFIYDKEKIIESPENFRAAYENKGGDKKIYVVIQSPKML